MTVNYDHSKNLHTLSGPQAAMPFLFAEGMQRSLLDVDVPAEKLLIPAK